MSKKRAALFSRERWSRIVGSRFVSPTGFVLVLLCFLLPFAAVSCEQPNAKITGEYTGSDFVVGGEPSFEIDGQAERPQPEPVDIEPATIVSASLIVIGIGVAFAPLLRIRLLGGLAAGVLAVIALIVGQRSAINGLVGKVAASDAISRDTAEGMVETRLGFWLALGLLIAVTLWNGGALLVQGRHPTAASPGAPQAPPGTQPPMATPPPPAMPPPTGAQTPTPAPAQAGDTAAWPPEEPPGPPRPS